MMSRACYLYFSIIGEIRLGAVRPALVRPLTYRLGRILLLNIIIKTVGSWGHSMGRF